MTPRIDEKVYQIMKQRCDKQDDSLGDDIRLEDTSRSVSYQKTDDRFAQGVQSQILRRVHILKPAGSKTENRTRNPAVGETDQYQNDKDEIGFDFIHGYQVSDCRLEKQRYDHQEKISDDPHR